MNLGQRNHTEQISSSHLKSLRQEEEEEMLGRGRRREDPQQENFYFESSV